MHITCSITSTFVTGSGGGAAISRNDMLRSHNLRGMARLFLALVVVACSCSAAPVSNVTTLFMGGDHDEHNRTWACTRGSNIMRAGKILHSFFSGMKSCQDGTKGSALLTRSSVDEGATWSPGRNPNRDTSLVHADANFRYPQ